MGEAKGGTARAERERRDRKIRELDRRGLSLVEIAKAMGVSRVTVSRALGRARSR